MREECAYSEFDRKENLHFDSKVVHGALGCEPITGAVSRIEATLYSAATPGVPLFYIVDTEHLKVCFDVLENELQKFEPGTRIQVYSVAYPSEAHEARISAISPVVEKNGMVHLEATLQPHPHLMPGMTAIVTKAR